MPLLCLLLIHIVFINILAFVVKRRSRYVLCFSKLHEIVNIRENLHGIRAEDSIVEKILKFLVLGYR